MLFYINRREHVHFRTLNQDYQSEYSKTIEEMKFYPRTKIIAFNTAALSARVTATTVNSTVSSTTQLEEAHRRAQEHQALQRKKVVDERL